LDENNGILFQLESGILVNGSFDKTIVIPVKNLSKKIHAVRAWFQMVSIVIERENHPRLSNVLTNIRAIQKS